LDKTGHERTPLDTNRHERTPKCAHPVSLHPKSATAGPLERIDARQSGTA
jgi:hypothetical protein